MNRTHLTKIEMASALARGVRQLVFIGTPKPAPDQVTVALDDGTLQLFAVDEEGASKSTGTFVPTRFESEELAMALSRSGFDKLKASLFIWLGDARYRTMETAISTLSFIASLPKGSGVVFDYAERRSSPGSYVGTALDGLASRFSCASDAAKHLIQPQAVAAMLRGVGFGQMTDHIDEELERFDGHIVCAFV